MRTFTIITPCRNAEYYIEDTLKSILNQSAFLENRVNLEYILVDGKSTDDTLRKAENILKRYKNQGNFRYKIISEEDSGMYDALSKGLIQGTGDVFAYINAGDIYCHSAFDIVSEILDTNPEVKWLTGMRVILNDKLQVVKVNVPYKYRQRLFNTGIYGRKLFGKLKLPYVQQESTFWCKELNEKINIEKLRKFKLAGDFFLWKSFSKDYQLYIVEAYLAGFRKHPGQLSTNEVAYFEEVKKICNRANLFDLIISLFDGVIWLLPGRIKKFFNKKYFFAYNHQNQTWY